MYPNNDQSDQFPMPAGVRLTGETFNPRDRWTNAAGDVSISARPDNRGGVVQYFSGDAARRYDAGAGYGAPEAVSPGGPMVPAMAFQADATPRAMPAAMSPGYPTMSAPRVGGAAGSPWQLAGAANIGRGAPGSIENPGGQGGGMSYEDRKAIFGRMGFSGRAGDALARAAFRAGATGGPQDLTSFVHTGMPAGQALALQQEQAARKAQYDAEVEAAKFGRETAVKREDAATAFGRDLVMKTGQYDPGAALEQIASGAALEQAGKDLALQGSAVEVAQKQRDAERRAQGLPTEAEAQNLAAQIAATQAAKLQPGETPEQAAVRVREEGAAKRTKGEAELKKTQVETERVARGVQDFDLDAQGFPVTHMKDGLVFAKSGGKWMPMGRAAGDPFGIAAAPPTGEVVVTPAAAAPAVDPNAAARAWLTANPKDPRAAAVRKRLGL